MNLMKKVLMIGIDGATFDFIQPFTKSGELKNIKKLMDNGVWGKLKSVIPPISITAWECLCKGKNPGKVGIYDYVMLDTASQNTKLFSWTAGDNIWDYLGKSGKKSIIFNIPGTYPPKSINGIMISGMLTPAGSSDFSTPKALVGELRRLIPNYEPELVKGNVIRDKLDFIPEMSKDLENKSKIIRYLLDQKEWDFFFLVIGSIDTIQHFFWNDKDVILKFYKKVDNLIGNIIENLNDDTNLILVSDHGNGRITKVLNMNAWLREKGYQKLKSEAIPITSALESIGVNRRRLLLLLSKLGLTHVIRMIPRKIRRRIPQDVITITTEDALENNLIDWNNTFAVSYGNTNNCIILNKRNFSLKVFNKKKKELLKDLKKFNDGSNLGFRILTKEEVYTGNKIDSMPDIFLVYDDKKCVLFSNNITDNEIFTKSPGWVANHSSDGIFIAYGPNIISGKKMNNAKLVDIMATILFMYGIRKPSDSDGGILKIFR